MGIFSKKRLSISGFRGFTKKLTGKRSRYQFVLGKLHKMGKYMKWGFRSYTDPDTAFSGCLIDNEGELCRFYTTKASGDVDILGNIMTSSELLVGKELSLDNMINLSIVKDTSNLSTIVKNSGNIISTGDCSNLTTMYGNYIISTGAYSTASICKHGGNIVITGYGSKAITSGGDYGKILSTGKSSTLINTCEFGLLNSKGKNSIVAGLGDGCKAKAGLGSWITLAEWREGKPNVVTKYVDGTKIKEDTWYALRNGEFEEFRFDD